MCGAREAPAPADSLNFQWASLLSRNELESGTFTIVLHATSSFTCVSFIYGANFPFKCGMRMHTPPYHVDFQLVLEAKKRSYILVGFRSLLAIWHDKGWGNPDRNVVAKTKYVAGERVDLLDDYDFPARTTTETWTLFFCGVRFIHLSKVVVFTTWIFSPMQNVFAEKIFIRQFLAVFLVWNVSPHKKECMPTFTYFGKCWTALLWAISGQKLR